jgi:RimJ/RimL family protein N-acetyltransferase
MSFVAPEECRTERCVLRCLRPGDGAALQRAQVASARNNGRFLAWPDEDQTVQEAEAVARLSRASWLQNESFILGIWPTEGTELLGCVGLYLRGRAWSSRTAEVGLWISQDHLRQGLATEVLAAVLAWALSDWPFERLEWRCHARNQASIQLAERCGMQLEGTNRSVHCPVHGRRDERQYSMIRSAHGKAPVRGGC